MYFEHTLSSYILVVIPDEATRLQHITEQVKSLPEAHKTTLHSLLLFLKDLAQHAEKNKMNMVNLSTRFNTCNCCQVLYLGQH